MLTRRGFAVHIGAAVAAGRMLPEMAYAQRAMISGDLPKDMVWLNANENPLGPPKSSLAAMAEVLASSGRYHYQEVRDFYAALARSEDLQADNILVGSGSSEMLHAAVDAFTAADRPMIVMHPTYEGPPEVARSMHRQVIQVPLLPDYSADVHKLADSAEKSHAGLIYMCNPNNPTASITRKANIAWLVQNLPADTVLLIDEAYIHFGESVDLETALPYVRQGKNVVVARTFSKIYGMAGVRAGFVCAPAGLIERMRPFRNNVLSIIAMRAVLAALNESHTLVPERRAVNSRVRRELCGWLRERQLPFIETQANFMMIDVGRNARDFITKMPPMGVAVGRPFPPLDNMLRVTIGTDQEMQKFRDVFWRVYKA
ncbi:MAG TPA: aminotransferase class I/II-fold pyridoxal phosphate-dependent enzyme [Bryobacteraceae bacterium]|nr:aminotransferase class I/II-fold pyridoxal phosphate-dependent enzyme [Bryobacteraceae bacterium]